MTCKCLSYNRPEPEQTVVSVGVAPFFQEKVVDIDACIVLAIQALWNARIATLGSCCGHNKRLPSVVLSNPDDAWHAREILARVDKREWEVKAWKLMDV